MSKGKREAIADWLMILGAPVLFLSLFLTWSHQFSSSFIAQYGHSTALVGVPRDPTAWQLYSVVDVLIAVLAVALLAVALRGPRAARMAVLLGLVVILAFTVHALKTPPTTGANLFDPSLKAYSSNQPTSGAGEIVALVGVLFGTGGVALSFTAD